MRLESGYYELTEEGRKILHSDNFTKIVLLISSAIASMLVGLLELYRFFKLAKPNSNPSSNTTPYNVLLSPTSPTSEVHLLSGLALIFVGIILKFTLQKV